MAAGRRQLTGPALTVLVVMGVSGAGKTTVGAALASRFGWEFTDGDEMHPPQNVATMTKGIPLTDDDRAPWLDAVATWIDEHQRAKQPAVVACSALAHRYRDRLRRPGVTFVFLEVPADELRDRLQRRTGHFMPESLLTTQLATLEPPTADEQAITIRATGDPASIVDAVVNALSGGP